MLCMGKPAEQRPEQDKTNGHTGANSPPASSAQPLRNTMYLNPLLKRRIVYPGSNADKRPVERAGKWGDVARSKYTEELDNNMFVSVQSAGKLRHRVPPRGVPMRESTPYALSANLTGAPARLDSGSKRQN